MTNQKPDTQPPKNYAERKDADKFGPELKIKRFLSLYTVLLFPTSLPFPPSLFLSFFPPVSANLKT